MAGDEKQRLLAAHARPERVYAPWIDAQPGDHCRHDARHSCQVLDLTWIAPGEAFEPPALALRIDDCKRAECGQVPPAIDVLLGRDAPPVGRDDQWKRRIVAGPVPTRQHDVGGSAIPVMGAVVDGDDPHLHGFPVVSARRPGCRGEREQHCQATQTRPSHRSP